MAVATVGPAVVGWMADRLPVVGNVRTLLWVLGLCVSGVVGATLGRLIANCTLRG